MLVLKGPTGQTACVRFLAKKRRRLPDLTLRTDETDVSLKTEHNSRPEQIPADATVFVSW